MVAQFPDNPRSWLHRPNIGYWLEIPSGENRRIKIWNKYYNWPFSSSLH
jgi:hypothetical protein